MAAIDWTNVTDLLSALSTVTLGWQTSILGYVNNSLNADTYGGEDSYRYKIARVYLAAHMGLIWKKKGEVTGAVVSEDVGADSIRIGYGKVDDLAKSLDLTFYGKEFERLTRETRAGFPLAW
jgi:hypothetical protein